MSNERRSPPQLPHTPEYREFAEPAEELPAYSRDGEAYEFYEGNMDEKKSENDDGSAEERLMLPTSELPGYAPEVILQKGLQVPTKTRMITSGFPYPEILSQYDINEEQWSAFTQELTKEAEMSPAQWSTTVGKGFGAFVVGGIFLGMFGLVPAALAGKKARQQKEAKNLSKARESNVLPEIINRWNNTFFRPKGLLIRIDLPGESIGMDTMDLASSKATQSTSSSSGDRSPPRQSRSERSKARSKAAKKGRIVILPLSRDGQPATSTSKEDDSYDTPRQSSDTMDTYPDEKRGLLPLI